MQVLGWALILAAGVVASALVTWIVMRARMSVALAREREALAEARGLLHAQKDSMELALRSAEDTARKKALDEFLADVRVEERHYVREQKVLFLTRKSLVMQERIFFRNLPLSNWIEHERLVEEGADIEKVARSLSVLDPQVLLGGGAQKSKRLPQ